MNLIVDPSKEHTKLPRVMRAAVKLFVEKGIDSTTTKDIALKARVAEGALYRHFKSKEELAWHIFSSHLNAFTIELVERIGREKTVHDKIRAYIEECFESFEQDKELFSFLIISEHRELKNFPWNSAHPGRVALRLIEEGQKEGALRRMDVYVGASILVGAVIRLCAVRMYGGIARDLRAHKEVVVESLWNALRK